MLFRALQPAFDSQFQRVISLLFPISDIFLLVSEASVDDLLKHLVENPMVTEVSMVTTCNHGNQLLFQGPRYGTTLAPRLSVQPPRSPRLAPRTSGTYRGPTVNVFLFVIKYKCSLCVSVNLLICDV